MVKISLNRYSDSENILLETLRDVWPALMNLATSKEWELKPFVFSFDPLSFVCHLLANKIVNFVFCPLTGATRGPRMKYENKINLFPPGWAGRSALMAATQVQVAVISQVSVLPFFAVTSSPKSF